MPVSTSTVSAASSVSAPQGFSGISNQSLIAASQMMATLDALGAKLAQKNEDANTLRNMKNLATALDGFRSNGVIKLTKTDKDGNEIVDTEKVQYLLDFIQANNQLYKDDPSNQISAFDGGKAGAGSVTVAQLNQFDLKINNISLFAKETATAALGSLDNQITAKLGLIEKDTIELNKVGNSYKNLVGLSAAMIDMLTKIMENILQRM